MILTSSHDIGIHVEALWQMIDQVGGLEAAAASARVVIPDGDYDPFPPNWNGQTISP